MKHETFEKQIKGFQIEGKGELCIKGFNRLILKVQSKDEHRNRIGLLINTRRQQLFFVINGQ